MKFSHIVAGALAALASLGTAALVQASVVHQAIHGRLKADGSRTAAVFHLASSKDAKGTVREQIQLEAKKLDTTKDAQGNPPDYHLWLVTKDGAAADFGWMDLNRSGNARYRFNSRSDTYPTDVTTITAFGEGKLEIRVGDTVVLDGTLPAFLKPGDDPKSGSEASVEDKTRLTASGSRSAGELQARYINNGKDVREQVMVKCQRMDGSVSPFSVVVIAADSTETTLFSGLRPRSRKGEFHATLDTRGGYDIPGGGVLNLSGLSVEVRDTGGNVMLSGKFPDLSVD